MYFSNLLVELKHKAAESLRKEDVKFAKLKWQTNGTDIDGGVFLMRHMETYQGGPITKYDSGLLVESEEQSRQIRKLRKKYATKILLSSLNIHVDLVLNESDAFARIPVKERKKILLEAYKRKEERFGSQ